MGESRTAFVAGGTGGIGEEVVKALLAAGFKVFVPTRPQDKADRLKAYVAGTNPGNLTLIPGDLGDSASVAKMRAEVLKAAGKLDLVVVSVGSKYFGYSLHKIPRDRWDSFLSENLITHFNLQHEFLDQLHDQKSGVYITLTGPESATVIPDAGMMSVMSAAQKMMTRVAAQEASGTGVRVHSVTSHTQVVNRHSHENPPADMIRASDLAAYILALTDKHIPGAAEPQHDLESRQHLEKLMRKYQ